MQQGGAIFKFPLAKLLLAVALFVISFGGHAQEVCDNGRDDDGDGLIDINDPDCQCYWQPTKNILLNPSFEAYAHCLLTPDFSQNFDMISNWQFGTTYPRWLSNFLL